MLILGIETSCDETAIAILQKKNGRLLVLSNVVSSQIKLHAKWGGVVPNLAAREHLKNIIPVLKSALKEANKKMDDIDLIAVTHGPGLIPALLIGTNFAKTLSYIYQKPLIGIHHIEGHIYANWIGVNSKFQISNLPAGRQGFKSNPNDLISNDKKISENTTSKKLTNLQANSANPKFPILSLVVSGGHTQLILMTDHFKYQVIGETQDDAAGEAFDKVARILGLGYPGGPAISAQADNFKFQISNLPAGRQGFKSMSNDLNSNDKKILKKDIKKPIFPRPMLHSHDFNFSFSGLKTSVLYYVKKYRIANNLAEDKKLPLKFIRETAYEFQEAATDILVIKTINAALKYNPQTIFIAGGVSANSNLREKMASAISKTVPHINYHPQPITYSTDNATMIAVAASYRWEKMTATKKKQALRNWRTLQTNAQLEI